MKNILMPLPHKLTLSQLLNTADRRMLSVAGQKIYDTFRIYLGTGHLVKEELSRLLITTQLLFLFEQEHIRNMTMNDIAIPSEIDFNFLAKDQIDLIINRIDIHYDRKYQIEHPFNFNYEFFGYYLDPCKEFNKILSAWADIMVNEWRVIHGIRLFIGFGYEDFSKKLHQGNKPLEYSGFSDNELAMIGETGVQLILLRGLWFANNLIYLSIKSIPNKFNSKIKRIEDNIKNINLTYEQKEFLKRFLLMADTIVELREWRNHDVHMVSETIKGVYSRNLSDKDLHQLWNRIYELHNTTKEAMFSLIGFIVSGHNYSPKYVLRIIGEGEQIKHKFYNQENPIEKSTLIELQEYAINKDWGNNAQRIMDILMDLWGIQITSNICAFKSFAAFNLEINKRK